VGLEAMITSSPDDVLTADGVVLPGVGAMPDAMQALDRLGLSEALRVVAVQDAPLFGICLGMQLLMEEGSEFVRHEGLGILPGRVVRFEGADAKGLKLKVPHIGWNAVRRPDSAEGTIWAGTPLEVMDDGEFMYFVHSYYVELRSADILLGATRYGDVEFCSAVGRGNVFGCQFHPERSGVRGLDLYRHFARLLAARGGSFHGIKRSDGHV
jgi:glutamine amidotransferase